MRCVGTNELLPGGAEIAKDFSLIERSTQHGLLSPPFSLVTLRATRDCKCCSSLSTTSVLKYHAWSGPCRSVDARSVDPFRPTCHVRPYALRLRQSVLPMVDARALPVQ